MMAFLMGKLMEYSMLDFESKFFDTVNDEVSVLLVYDEPQTLHFYLLLIHKF